MKKTLENLLAMYKAVIIVLTNFKASWQSSKAFSDSVNTFKGKKDEIDALRSKSESRSNGVTEKKEIIHVKLIDQADSIIKILKAYFTKKNDTVVFDKVNISKSDLNKARENELVSIVKDILEIANGKKDELVDYQVTEATLTELSETISNFEQEIAAPRITIGERKEAKKDLEKLFKEANSILSNELDMMITPYEKSSPDFYKAYKNAREVVDYGTRHEKGNDNKGPDKNNE